MTEEKEKSLIKVVKDTRHTWEKMLEGIKSMENTQRITQIHVSDLKKLLVVYLDKKDYNYENLIRSALDFLQAFYESVEEILSDPEQTTRDALCNIETILRDTIEAVGCPFLLKEDPKILECAIDREICSQYKHFDDCVTFLNNTKIL